MNKILIEGSGCTGDSCITNLTSSEWIINRPSIMVWADSIFISEQDYSFLTSGAFVRDDSEMSEDMAQLVTSLKNEKIIELFNPNKLLGKTSKDSITAQIEYDLKVFGIPASKKDENGKQQPAHIERDGVHYCPVILGGIYSSLLESKFLGCTCVMDPEKASFAFSRFGSLYPSSDEAANVFDELYTVLVPELRIYHDYRLFCSAERKNECVHGGECTHDREKNLRRFFDDLMFLRDNPTLKSLKGLIESKEQELQDENALLRKAVLRDISKSQKKLFESYPRARKWMKYAAAISSATLAAISSSPTEALLPAAGIMGASHLIDASIEQLTKRDQWKIAFCESRKSRLPTPLHPLP